MEGLMKGLLNVALDAVAAAGNKDDEEQQRDEEARSRSTWAEVVSSDKPESTRSNSSQHLQAARKQEGNNIAEDGWETVGETKRQKNQYQAGGDGRQQPSSGPSRQPFKSGEWGGYKKPPSEQQYSEYTHHNLNTNPTEEELADISKACRRLWDLDTNRLAPGKDYNLEIGGGKKVFRQGDMAPENLFTWVKDDVLQRPTYSRFIALLDNYNPREGVKEKITTEEKHEQAAFIEELVRTAPIKYLHKYLTAKGIIASHDDEMKKMMTSLWFDIYGRGGGYGSSSAFEHVFVGEIKGRDEHEEVSGFHNWIQFYIEEAKGNVNYQGYIFPRSHGENPNSATQVLTIQFEWNGLLKSISTTLIGVSPEFEIALYTLCFFAGSTDNYVRLGPYSVNIKCYRFGHNKIGSAFPIVEN